MSKNKDWNYIAAVEKSIAEKYGKNTVQDFRSEWEEEKEKSYLEQLKVRTSKLNQRRDINETVIKDGLVIKKRNKNKAAERRCPVCKTYSFSRSDDLYMNRFECCQRCYVVFVVNREERWQEGWRPDEDQVKKSLRRK